MPPSDERGRFQARKHLLPHSPPIEANFVKVILCCKAAVYFANSVDYFALGWAYLIFKNDSDVGLVRCGWQIDARKGTC